MGVIAIRFDDEDERKLKAIATTQGKKISEYCRELILNKKMVKPENYIIIENELAQIKDNIKILNQLAGLTEINASLVRIENNIKQINDTINNSVESQCTKKSIKETNNLVDLIGNQKTKMPQNETQTANMPMNMMKIENSSENKKFAKILSNLNDWID